MPRSAADDFLRRFLAEMQAEGLSPETMARHAWAPPPATPFELDALQLSPAQVSALLGDAPSARLPERFCQDSRLALILVPGFTHETLRHFSWHEVMDAPDSPHKITVLHADNNGLREEQRGRGTGLRMAYVRYPRSNAAPEHILPAMARMLEASPTLKAWAGEGYRFVFVGYSNGAPLALELLAGLNAGRFSGDWLLEATAGWFSLCGDLGGSWLADDVIGEAPRLVDLRKAVDRARRLPWLGKMMGLGTAQLQDDMIGGVQSLGHAVRQERLARALPELPTHLHYFCLAAVLPLADYRRHWWQANLDDYAMWKQALITDPVTPLNDGQVALEDALLPQPPQLPEAQLHLLGAVRAHHWAVSYRSFQLGHSRFPRAAQYRAALHYVASALAESRPAIFQADGVAAW